jgi:hypothetical protein
MKLRAKDIRAIEAHKASLEGLKNLQNDLRTLGLRGSALNTRPIDDALKTIAELIESGKVPKGFEDDIDYFEDLSLHVDPEEFFLNVTAKQVTIVQKTYQHMVDTLSDD